MTVLIVKPKNVIKQPGVVVLTCKKYVIYKHKKKNNVACDKQKCFCTII